MRPKTLEFLKGHGRRLESHSGDVITTAHTALSVMINAAPIFESWFILDFTARQYNFSATDS